MLLKQVPSRILSYFLQIRLYSSFSDSCPPRVQLCIIIPPGACSKENFLIINGVVKCPLCPSIIPCNKDCLLPVQPGPCKGSLKDIITMWIHSPAQNLFMAVAKETITILTRCKNVRENVAQFRDIQIWLYLEKQRFSNISYIYTTPVDLLSPNITAYCGTFFDDRCLRSKNNFKFRPTRNFLETWLVALRPNTLGHTTSKYLWTR